MAASLMFSTIGMFAGLGIAMLIVVAWFGGVGLTLSMVRDTVVLAGMVLLIIWGLPLGAVALGIAP